MRKMTGDDVKILYFIIRISRTKGLFFFFLMSPSYELYPLRNKGQTAFHFQESENVEVSSER